MSTQTISKFRSFVLSPIACAILALLGLVVGCGDAAGGGSSPGSPRGRLSGSVSGIQYETDTLSGVTEEDGGFYYEPGQNVRFRLGDTLLGEAEGASLLSPFDLAGIEPITNGRDGAFEAGRAFHRVANLLVLFETLDYDGAPESGFEITPDVAALFEGVELELDKPVYAFRTDRGFREALNTANSELLLIDHRAPRGPAPALNRLYDELGLQTGFYVAAVSERDDGNDGTIEDRNERAFDAHGFLVRDAFQSLSEGDYESFHTLNDWGDSESFLGDVGADGSIDSAETTSFDRDGNRTRVESDRDADGRVDAVTEYAYDEIGRLVSDRDDNDADGVPDWVRHRSYDDDERSETTRVDTDADGVIDSITVFYFDEFRQTLRTEFDTDADGSLDRIDHYRYDENGNETEHRSDRNGNGIVDSVTRREYDDGGRLYRYTRDDDDDGIPSSVETRRYDEQGRRIAIEVDGDADGAIDSVETYEYHDGSTGPFGAPVRLHRHDEDNDGVAESQTVRFYDENDFVVQVLSDVDGDSIADIVRTYTPLMVGWGYFLSD